LVVLLPNYNTLSGIHASKRYSCKSVTNLTTIQ
jgi:hypothetical protein